MCSLLLLPSHPCFPSEIEEMPDLRGEATQKREKRQFEKKYRTMIKKSMLD
jgi:hypothetical protein